MLNRVGAALAAFDNGQQPITDRPQLSLLTTSTFGRRLRGYNSGGTDHGSASVSLLLGGTCLTRSWGSTPAPANSIPAAT